MQELDSAKPESESQAHPKPQTLNLKPLNPKPKKTLNPAPEPSCLTYLEAGLVIGIDLIFRLCALLDSTGCAATAVGSKG